MKNLLYTLAFCFGLGVCAANAQGVGQFQPGGILGNATAAQAAPQDNLLTSYIDRNFCSTQNDFLQRGASNWGCVANIVVTSNSINALTVGPNGTSNPAFNVDASSATSATGINIKSQAAGGGATISVISSGSNETLSINAKGASGINIANVSTGTVAIFANTTVQTSNSVGFAVGQNGGTNPALNVDPSTASSATGLNIKSAAAGAGVAISVISSGTNENATIDAKGAGQITINSIGTGNINLSRNVVISGTIADTVTNSSALAIGQNGATNPAFLVDSSVASSVTGVRVNSGASGGGAGITAISSATNESLVINAKGSGTVLIGSVSTGGVQLAAGGGGVTVNGPFTATGLVTNADLANITTAWSLKGNNSASTSATPADFAIGSLTNKASPASTDILLLQDQAASGQLKYCTIAQCISAVSSGVSTLNALSGAVVLNGPVTSASGTNIQIAVASPSGRLTLAANTPVMVASNTSQSTLRYDCFRAGNTVPYFDGTFDQVDTIASCEVTDAMAASGSGGLSANNVFDVWWVHSGANRICVANGAAAGSAGNGWASDTGGSTTARGSGFSALDFTTRSYITNVNAIAHCWNGTTDYGSVAANRATYLGTILTDISNAGQVSFTFGTIAANGGGARFGVWNAYNRQQLVTFVADNTGSWTYAPSPANTFREAHGSTTFNVTQVFGISQDPVSAANTTISTPAASASSIPGIGVDSTTIFCGATGYITVNSQQSTAQCTTIPGVGVHAINALETGSTTAAGTWFGWLAANYGTGMNYQGQY